MATTDNNSPATPAKKAAPRRKAASRPAGKALTAPAEGAPVPLRQEASNMVRKLKSSAKDAAHSGKEKTTDTLDGVTAMVEDVARTIDERVGPQYGAYARRAADALSGMSETLKSKDVDALLDDVRDFVRRRPAVAIGAAAALGFVLTRLLKADQDEDA
ncbi:MAG: hypothetical protein ACKOXK_01440 [Chakrabartia sp.]